MKLDEINKSFKAKNQQEENLLKAKDNTIDHLSKLLSNQNNELDLLSKDISKANEYTNNC